MLFVLAVVARTPALGRYVTPDELNWVYRTIRFREALAAGDWANTIQSGHPGIVTMWLAAAALQLQLLFHPADYTHLQWASALYWLDPQNDDAFRHLAVFLTAARGAVIVITSLGLVAVYQLIHRVVSPQAGVLATLLLIFDPFTAGLSGLLHVDALLATFCLLAVLLVWRVMSDSRPQTLFLHGLGAGALTALAVLTKTPGIVLLLFVPGMVLFAAATQTQWPRAFRFLWGWGVGGAVTGFVVLPALAAAPQHVLDIILGSNEWLLERPTFFLGELTQTPDWRFYPLAIFLRLAPVIFLGVILPGGAWVKRLWTKRVAWGVGWREVVSRPEFTLLVFALIFLLFLHLGEKKYDRYILPSTLPFLLVVGLAWARWAEPWAGRWRQVLPLFLVGGQLWFYLSVWPYPLTAYNWLAGGTAVARQVLPMGWGEGASAAAIFLRDHATDTTRPILTSSIPSVAPFYPGPVLRYHEDTLVQMTEPPYVILTEQDRQLSRETETVDPATPLSLATFPGEWVAEEVLHFNGLDRAWLYGPSATEHLPLRPLTWQSANFYFQQAVTLHRAGIIASAWPDPAYIGLEWSVQQPGPYQLQLAIRDATGYVWSFQELPLLNEADQTATFWPPGERTAVYYRLPVRADVPPGDYQLQVALFDGQGAQLGVFADEGRFVGVAAAPLTFPLSSPATQPAFNLPNPQPAGNVAGYETIAAAIGTGERLTLDVWWRVDAAAITTLTLQTDHFTLPFTVNMSDWTPGHIVHLRLTGRIPVAAPTGSFPLFVNGVLLGNLTIEARDRQYELPAAVTPLAIQVGTLAFLQQVEVTVTGDSLTLDVIWQVNVPNGVAYTTFVHVRDASGVNIDQQDRSPSIPTATWVEGQVITDQFSFILPPPGVYTLALGLYQANGQRLPLYDADGNPLSDEYRLELVIP